MQEINFVELFYCLPCRRARFGYEGDQLERLEDSSSTPRKQVLNSSRVKAALAEVKAELPDAFPVIGVTVKHDIAESGFMALGEVA